MSEKDHENASNEVDLKALHARIKAGELDKKGAAAALGWSYPRLCGALRRAGLLDDIRTPRATAKYDTEAMRKALEEATAPDNVSVNAAVTDFARRNLAAIARKHGVPAEQYASFAMRVLHITRSRMKADLTDVQDQHSGAAPGS